jgi:hypothetical protein
MLTEWFELQIHYHSLIKMTQRLHACGGRMKCKLTYARVTMRKQVIILILLHLIPICAADCCLRINSFFTKTETALVIYCTSWRFCLLIYNLQRTRCILTLGHLLQVTMAFSYFSFQLAMLLQVTNYINCYNQKSIKYTLTRLPIAL